MSEKYYKTTHIHPFSWDLVANAIFSRYPNPNATHVLSEDTVHRGISKSGNILYSRRFLTKINKMPKWGERWMPSSIYRFVPLVEESHVDRDSKIVTTYTRNVGLSRFMTAIEKVRYQPNPENPLETIAVKEAWIESGLYGLRSAVKSLGIERFKNNCVKATEGFNHVLIRFHEKQQYLTELKQKTSLEIKTRSENAIKQAGIRATTQIARAADMVHNTKNKAADRTAAMLCITAGRYRSHASKMKLRAEECRSAYNASSTIEK